MVPKSLYNSIDMEEQGTSSTEQKKCPHCGASLRKNWVRLTPLLVHALVKFKQAVINKGENHIHLLKDMRGTAFELSLYEWNNFTKVRFHGLAVKSKQSGYWILTRRGNQFLLGQIEVPDRVLTFRNRIEAKSDRLVKVRDVIGSEPYAETLLDMQYEYADLPETADLPIIVKPKKKPKKGQEACPRCGDILKSMVHAEPNEKGDAMKVIKWKQCPTCKHETPRT